MKEEDMAIREQQKPTTVVEYRRPINISSAKPRLSCAACSSAAVAGKLRYPPPEPQNVSSPNPKRSHSKSLPAHHHHHHHEDNNRSQQSSNSLPLGSYRSSSDQSFHNNTTTTANNNNNSLGLSTSASTSFDGPGFKLNFDSGASDQAHPNIKCHIDHLDRDLELDVKLERDEHHHHHHNNNNNNDNNNNNCLQPSSKFSLNCYNPSDPDKNIKLKVELFRTSAKGYGLRIMQSMPRTSFNNSEYGGSISKKELRRDKCDVDSRASSSSHQQAGIPKFHDISDLDEVRISSGKLSKAGSDEDDHCKCTTPCGAPHCKAEEKPQEQDVR